MRREAGYFAILAIIFIMVMGLIGVATTYMFANRAQISVAQINGLRAFYNAESGLEIGARLLTRPAITGALSRLSCANITSDASTTNAAMGTGTITVVATNNAPYAQQTTLSTAETAADTTINLTSASGFAPSGRVLIDKESINYASVSGNTLIGVMRGANGTLASAHTIGTPVSQYQCRLVVTSGVPNLTSPKADRELNWNVQLQEAWAVGNLSLTNYIYTRWNRATEKAWSASTVSALLNVANLNAISMLSNADGWAVGDRANSNYIFLRWNGSSWVLNALAGSCSGQDLNGVSMVSSQQGFAVGGRYRPSCAASGNYRYTILRYTGSAWTVLTPTTTPSIPADAAANQNLNAVHVIDTNGDGVANIGFAVGNAGVILRYNGTQWTAMTSPTTQNLLGVYTVSAQEAWAVGATGGIFRYNGTAWSTFTSPVTSSLNGIAMFDKNGDGLADYGWIAGTSARILSYNGSSWSSTDLGSTTLLGVDYFNENDVWVVGANGVSYHWDGSAWTSIATGTAVQLNAISVVSREIYPTSSWQQTFG